MKLIQVIITCAAIFIVTTAPAKAEIIDQLWVPFEFPVTDDFGCAGEDGLAQDMVHVTVVTIQGGHGGLSYQDQSAGDILGSSVIQNSLGGGLGIYVGALAVAQVGGSTIQNNTGLSVNCDHSTAVVFQLGAATLDNTNCP